MLTMSDHEASSSRYITSAEYDELLNSCLTAIERGEATVESCVLQYPDLEDLGPMLQAAAIARKLPEVDFTDSSYTEVQKRVLANFRKRNGPKPSARQ